MEWQELTLDQFRQADGLAPQYCLFVFANCKIWLATKDSRRALLIREHRTDRVVVCVYENEPEFVEDVAYLRGLLPPSSGPSADPTRDGVPVGPRPTPTAQTPGDAAPLPVEAE